MSKFRIEFEVFSEDGEIVIEKKQVSVDIDDEGLLLDRSDLIKRLPGMQRYEKKAKEIGELIRKASDPTEKVHAAAMVISRHIDREIRSQARKKCRMPAEK